MEYYSDQLKGYKTRDKDKIPHNVWGGIVATINGLINSNAFAKYFPKNCPDEGIYSTDQDAFQLALKAEVPDIKFPFITEKPKNDDVWATEKEPFTPDYLLILDLIQFSHEYVSEPIKGKYCKFPGHYHLNFDEEIGKENFRDKINRIFVRNGISYQLQNNGNITRLAPEILGEFLYSTRFQTQDQMLNQMLEDARKKFLNPDKNIRRESLERLWDAWERIKTILNPNDKKKSVGLLLDKCADEPKFRELIDAEAISLTKVGNTFQIRHSEIGQIEINRSEQIDYLFHRLFSLILLAIRKNQNQNITRR
ncbi:Uncharacterized protein dnl_36320 [Desulfonema limicola]|uniref:HEPN AbiJ-N-terminal domain-containing protein n=1 Tax=Desulfonema limicola TaxID=45656 RepID=A0A975GHG6_9BACT|nr:hypothetical protein [Desulfonema limicola]QTA81299.1 Uncharacterized protein dnl_36320 [Desulfonema limicola]